MTDLINIEESGYGPSLKIPSKLASPDQRSAPDVLHGAEAGDHPHSPVSGGRRPSDSRLRSETTDLRIHVGDGWHDLAVCLAVDDDYRIHELNFVTRGKIGHGLDDMLSELGIQISRVLQGRDPVTGQHP